MSGLIGLISDAKMPCEWLFTLGMALALNKKIFLCSETKEEFNMKNTVNFY